MNHTRILSTAVASWALVAAGALAASPAAADTGPPPFAEHVRTHAQAGELNGSCNPGMHRGITGAHEPCGQSAG